MAEGDEQQQERHPVDAADLANFQFMAHRATGPRSEIPVSLAALLGAVCPNGPKIDGIGAENEAIRDIGLAVLKLQEQIGSVGKMAADYIEAAQRGDSDLADRLAAIEQRIRELATDMLTSAGVDEASADPLPLFLRKDGDASAASAPALVPVRRDALADLEARIAALEDKAGRVIDTREKATAAVIKAARARMLETVENHVLYEMAMLAQRGNSDASLTLSSVRPDVATFASELIVAREGTNRNRKQSDWGKAVRLSMARGRALKIVAEADELDIGAVAAQAIREIEAVI